MPQKTDKRHEEAIKRFRIIAPLLDTEPGLADGRAWRSQICERNDISQRTLRRWLQRYREKGFDGLYPKVRKDKGSRRSLSDEAFEQAKEMRRELPERSAERIRDVLLADGHRVTRSTLERHLRQEGFSARILKKEGNISPNRGRRFQHSQRNSLWQADFKAGPFLPNPKQQGKNMRTWLLIILDNATRKIIHAEFYFSEDTLSLFDGLRKAISVSGCPRRFHTDQGAAFTSNWTRLVCARLGIQHLLALPYSPESKGAVERVNRTVEEFIREVMLEQPKSLMELNQKLRLWVTEGYNRRSHRALAIVKDGISVELSPEAAYSANTAPLRMVSPETLQQAFLWEERRKVDKSGCISLQGTTYDTGLNLLRKTVELRFNPLDLTHIEIYYQGQYQGLAKPLVLSENNGVRRSAVRKAKVTKPVVSRVLGVLAKQERRRIASDVGAFILSNEEGMYRD